MRISLPCRPMILLLVGLSGCMVVGPDHWELHVQLVDEALVLRFETIVYAVVENRTPDTVYYNACSTVRLEALSGGRVVGEWWQAELACFEETPLMPGEQMTAGYLVQNLSEEDRRELEAHDGPFRLRVPPLWLKPASLHDTGISLDPLYSARFHFTRSGD